MTRAHGAVRGTLMVALLLAIPGEAGVFAVEPTLAAVEGCMGRLPAPWPEAWQREYVDTVRQAIASDADTPEYAARLGILRRGFPPYWEGLKKSQDRALFEVHGAQIRWYVENLMATKLPGEEERQRLRDQYTTLWNHAASALLAQFPFLDPNAVKVAQAERCAECYRQIDAPLLPIFQRPFSDEQIDQIKQRWHDLRYARVDLWRQLAGEGRVGTQNLVSPPGQTQPLQAPRHYLLTERSLAQWLAQIWAIGASAPDYYQIAVRNRMDAQRRVLQSKSQAGAADRALERRYSRQLLQTEQLSFLLAALLETAQHPPSEPPDERDGPMQGGDPRVE